MSAGPPRLLLAGLGHAHLFVLEALARGRFPPVQAILVSPEDRYFYSGMVSGVIAGSYRPEEALLHPPRLARSAGAAWVRGRVVRVDSQARRVELEDGRTLHFDLLSLNVGARLGSDEVPGSDRHGLPIRPFTASIGLRQAALAAARRGSGRMVVVGGGAGGWEIAMCLDAALHRAVGRGRYLIEILEGGSEVLGEHPMRVRRRAAELLRARGIEVRTGARVREADAREVHTEGGQAVPYDLLLWATGPRAPALFRDSALPADDRGYLRVLPSLRADGVDSVFGAGDCVGIAGYPWVPRAGVYAVREGPVLAANLIRRLRGEPLEEYRPQRHWLSLMSTGDGRALMSYRGATAHARALWWLKDRIDRRFVLRFTPREP